MYSGWWAFGKKDGKGTYVYADTGARVINLFIISLLVIGRKIKLLKGNGYCLMAHSLKEYSRIINQIPKVH